MYKASSRAPNAGSSCSDTARHTSRTVTASVRTLAICTTWYSAPARAAATGPGGGAPGPATRPAADPASSADSPPVGGPVSETRPVSPCTSGYSTKPSQSPSGRRTRKDTCSCDSIAAR